MPKPLILGELEQLVLLAVLQLGDDAYVLPLRRRLERAVGRAPSRGALYRTLDRLEQKGLVGWQIEAGGPARGGHPRRRFAVSEAGIVALRTTRHALLGLWDGLEAVLE